MPSSISPIDELKAFLEGHDPDLTYFELVNSKPELVEILDYISLAKRCGYNYARKVGKQKNKQFIDESQAEAMFWLFMLFEELYWDIMWQESKEAFIRMRLSYKLKEYWASRDSLSLSYFRRKGKDIPTHGRITRRETLQHTDDDWDDEDRPRQNNQRLYAGLSEENLEVLESDILDSVLRDGVDARILSLYCDGSEPWIIALEVRRSPEFVHKTLTRIERGISNAYVHEG